MATEQEKSQRFKRVAEARTNKIIESIRLLGNCSNKSNYSYSEDDVKKIFNAIENELKMAKQRYKEKSKCSKFEL